MGRCYQNNSFHRTAGALEKLQKMHKLRGKVPHKWHFKVGSNTSFRDLWLCISYNQIYLGSYEGETVTEEEFVPREFEKNVHKDGTVCEAKTSSNCQKAIFFAHYTLT